MNKKISNPHIDYDTRKKRHEEDMKDFEYKEAYEEELALYTLAEEIRELRHKKHYTQKDLAEKAGIKQQEISRIEKGGQNITIGMLNKIAKGMGKRVKISIV